MVEFFFEDISNFPIDDLSISRWINSCVEEESNTLGDLSYIFCSDTYLLKVNRDYLNHDYYTDIITFNYNEGDIISGDLFVSIDRVKDYAKEYNIDFKLEFKRVLIHGVLHLLGYNDKTDEEVVEMRNKEDYYILKYSGDVASV